jgi:hypothetical protein
MGIEITVTEDRTQWDILTARLRRSGGARIEAGLFSATQARKGFLNEVGSRDGKLPSRPWMSTTADNSVPAIGEVAGKGIHAIMLGADPRVAYDPVGALVEDRLVDTIKGGRVPGPPNAESTIRAKRHAQVLIGKLHNRRSRDPHMVDSITHRVRVRKAAKP